MVLPIIKQRKTNSTHELISEIGIHPVLQRIYQCRGIKSPTELERMLTGLLPFKDLLNISKAVELLYKCLVQKQHIMIVGDYDADGATSTALAVRALSQFGATKVSYIVPNRFHYGYGLTPEIVAVAAKQEPDLIMTVDNGISSVAGVRVAKDIGINVLITDHHLQGEVLPEADAIVNPNQSGDKFASKALAGVGVCFYLMLALRSKLVEENWFLKQGIEKPNMASLLDLVAFGTVADVVPLDKNNRILVYQGLRRIRSGHCVPGITALIEISKRMAAKLTASDLGFALGPRLNAAGRLEDMSLGIECLLTDDVAQARLYAQRLNSLNLERREIEKEMKAQALDYMHELNLNEEKMPIGVCLYDKDWHQGVIGILASRIKDQYHRPVIVFADAGNSEIKGSARSVSGVHIRDVLDNIAKRYPQLITKFGGHAMAAGLSISLENYNEFSKVFDDEIKQHLKAEDLYGEIYSDGDIAYEDFNLSLAELLQDAGPWGQAFPEPIFDGEFEIIDQRIVGQHHLRLSLKHPGGERIFSGIKFNVDLNKWPNYRCQNVHIAYKLDINEYNGVRNLQLMIEHMDAIV